MLSVRKEGIQQIPFRQGKVLEVQIGFLIYEAEGTEAQKVWRYSRSMELIRDRYRITLQKTDDPNYATYVFDAIRKENTGEIQLDPDNPDAKEVDSNVRKEIEIAVKTIFEHDIESDSLT